MTAPAPVSAAESGIEAALTLFAPIAEAREETAVFAYFDPKWRLLGTRSIPSGGADAVAIPIKTVVADAAACDCAAVVMAHNHPSGDPAPSDADYAITRRIARALSDIGVRLVDHLILARCGCESFRARGLL